jgi:hypothetical protein
MGLPSFKFNHDNRRFVRFHDRGAPLTLLRQRELVGAVGNITKGKHAIGDRGRFK